MLRYKEKRKNRKFDKTIRCAAPVLPPLPTLPDGRPSATRRARRTPRRGRASRVALPSAARCPATRATFRPGRTASRPAAAAACPPTTGWTTLWGCSLRRDLGGTWLHRRCSRRSRGCVRRGTYDRVTKLDEFSLGLPCVALSAATVDVRATAGARCAVRPTRRVASLSPRVPADAVRALPASHCSLRRA